MFAVADNMIFGSAGGQRRMMPDMLDHVVLVSEIFAMKEDATKERVGTRSPQRRKCRQVG